MDIIYTGICTLKVTNYPHSEWTKDYHVQNIKQASIGFFKQQPYFSFSSPELPPSELTFSSFDR